MRSVIMSVRRDGSYRAWEAEEAEKDGDGLVWRVDPLRTVAKGRVSEADEVDEAAETFYMRAASALFLALDGAVPDDVADAAHEARFIRLAEHLVPGDVLLPSRARVVEARRGEAVVRLLLENEDGSRAWSESAVGQRWRVAEGPLARTVDARSAYPYKLRTSAGPYGSFGEQTGNLLAVLRAAQAWWEHVCRRHYALAIDPCCPAFDEIDGDLRKACGVAFGEPEKKAGAPSGGAP